MPELMQENEDAIRVFQKVKLQAIYVGMGGEPVDLDFKALEFTMDMLGVEDKVDCFEKVCMIWHHCLAIENLKKKKDAK